MTTTTANTGYVSEAKTYSKRKGITEAILHVAIFLGTIVGIWFSSSLLIGLMSLIS